MQDKKEKIDKKNKHFQCFRKSYLVQSVKNPYDNSLSHAEQKIKQSGAQGMTVNVYKVTKLDGTIISKELISQDIYNSLEKIVVKGQ